MQASPTPRPGGPGKGCQLKRVSPRPSPNPGQHGSVFKKVGAVGTGPLEEGSQAQGPLDATQAGGGGSQGCVPTLTSYTRIR